MSMAAAPAPQTDRAFTGGLTSPATALASDAYAKEAIISWYRGEFAAANAIIDALCSHLAQIAGVGGAPAASEYDAAFAAIHRRRLNWIPVLQMQKYHSIAEVTLELANAATKKVEAAKESIEKQPSSDVFYGFKEKQTEKVIEQEGTEAAEEVEDDSPYSDITDSGSQEARQSPEIIQICSNHENCESRTSLITPIKGFQAKEHVKGHNVNVVKGLKLYEGIFDEHELSKLTDFVDELRAAGQNGELSGETFILFNKQMKGNKRELIQLGVPIFGHVKDKTSDNKQTVNIEPIPALLQSMIDHLVEWKLIPEYKKPNGCVINFFEEDEYSQPFLKPPHLEQPISTLVLSESTMAYGRILSSDNEGNFKGSLSLSLKRGSLLVMRGNSADLARHVMCPSPNKRVSITFFRVRSETNQCSQSPPTTPRAGVMTLWQPGMPSEYAMPSQVQNGYDTMDPTPKWGVFRAPVLMLAPANPMVMSPKRLNSGGSGSGTGVFLPWNGGPRKPLKHLPPRAQKRRLLALPSPLTEDSGSDAGISVAGA